MGENQGKVENQRKVEDEYTTKPVPIEQRKPWTYHAAAWAGVCFVLAALMGGGTPLGFLPPPQAIVTIILGNLVLFAIFYLTSYAGAKHGLSTYMLARQAFGEWGSRALVNWVVSGIPSFAWYGVETWLAGAAIAVIAGWDIGGPGRMMDLPSTIFMLVSGILMAIPPVLGITSIAIIDYISVPVMALLIIYGIYIASGVISIGEFFSFTPATYRPETALINFMLVLNLVIGLIAVGATISADTARWIKPIKKQVFLAGLLGFFSVAVFMEIVGMFFGLAAIKAGLDASLAWNIILVFVKLGASGTTIWPLLLVVWILQFTTNILNAYSGGLSIATSIGRPKYRSLITMAGAIIGTIIAILGIVWYWISYLNALANWVLPVAGVIVAEYYLVRKNGVTQEPPKKVRTEAIVGWFIGGLTSYLLSTYTPYFVPSLVGFFLAMIIHLIGGKIARRF